MPLRTEWDFPNFTGLSQDEFEEVRFQFSKATCNGCHSFENPRIPTVDGVYHISPHGEISRYLTEEALPERKQQLCALVEES